MIKPFKTYHPQTQSFGGNAEMYRRFNLIGHNGIDYGMAIGTEIISPIEGVVVEADYDEGGYGWYVKIENAVEGALMAHLSEVKVEALAIVEQGQLLGLSGNTGNSTGPHLHLGYYRIPRNRSNGYNGYIDPEPYFTNIGDKIMEVTSPLNTYGLDDTNLASKQIVYDIYRDVVHLGLYLKKDEANKLIAEANHQAQDYKNQLDEVKRITDEKFKLLDTFSKYGINTEDDLKLMAESLMEMEQAGFPTLQSIKDYTASLELQVGSLSDAVKAGITDKNKIIELQEKINKLNAEYASYDKTTFINRIAQAVVWLKNRVITHKAVPLVVKENLEPITEADVVKLGTAVEAFNSVMGLSFTNRKE